MAEYFRLSTGDPKPGGAKTGIFYCFNLLNNEAAIHLNWLNTKTPHILALVSAESLILFCRSPYI